ncbi:MAG: NAD(P)H-hydrate dehydratase [Gammaproteobacteria bacterium]|nr:NAD(P)H-hydrate dehydratase [Gammaproteobacteria bacterium]
MSKSLPRALYRAEQVRELDRRAIEALGIEEFELMRRAGAAAFSRLQERWPRAGSLLVLAGAGNNGGDGYVIAALAAKIGLRVQIVYLSNPEKLDGAAARAWRMAAENGAPMCSFQEFRSRQWQDFELVADALFGTGLNRAAEGEWLEAIEWINASGLPVLAVDIPSGLHADTGTPMGAAVRARLTVTFIGMKRGLLTHRGPDCTGELIFENLDAPAKIQGAGASTTAEVKRIDIHSSTGFLPPREPSSHKGSNGHVLLLGGDHGMGGAIILAAEAALRSGAGLVSVVTRSGHRPALLARRPEIMVTGTEDGRVDLPALFDRASNIVIGPGLGLGEWSRNLLQAALSGHSTRGLPLVTDADALRLLAQKAVPEIDFPQEDWILTPHPGEAAALLGIDVAEVQRDRFAAAGELQRRYGGHCLLKGAGSLICIPGSPPRIKLCSEGNPGMASAGMGDVLSGIIAGLHAQGLSLEDSLCCAACIHGEAADLAAQEAGQRGLIATDLMPFIRRLVNPSRSHPGFH